MEQHQTTILKIVQNTETYKQCLQTDRRRSESLEKELLDTKLKLDRLQREQLYNFAVRRRRALESCEQDEKNIQYSTNDSVEDVVDSGPLMESDQSNLTPTTTYVL